jgi:hypothetical protein
MLVHTTTADPAVDTSLACYKRNSMILHACDASGGSYRSRVLYSVHISKRGAGQAASNSKQQVKSADVLPAPNSDPS